MKFIRPPCSLSSGAPPDPPSASLDPPYSAEGGVLYVRAGSAEPEAVCWDGGLCCSPKGAPIQGPPEPSPDLLAVGSGRVWLPWLKEGRCSARTEKGGKVLIECPRASRVCWELYGPDGSLLKSGCSDGGYAEVEAGGAVLLVWRAYDSSGAPVPGPLGLEILASYPMPPPPWLEGQQLDPTAKWALLRQSDPQLLASLLSRGEPLSLVERAEGLGSLEAVACPEPGVRCSGGECWVLSGGELRRLEDGEVWKLEPGSLVACAVCGRDGKRFVTVPEPGPCLSAGEDGLSVLCSGCRVWGEALSSDGTVIEVSREVPKGKYACAEELAGLSEGTALLWLKASCPDGSKLELEGPAPSLTVCTCGECVPSSSPGVRRCVRPCQSLTVFASGGGSWTSIGCPSLAGRSEGSLNPGECEAFLVAGQPSLLPAAGDAICKDLGSGFKVCCALNVCLAYRCAGSVCAVRLCGVRSAWVELGEWGPGPKVPISADASPPAELVLEGVPDGGEIKGPLVDSLDGELDCSLLPPCALCVRAVLRDPDTGQPVAWDLSCSGLLDCSQAPCCCPDGTERVGEALYCLCGNRRALLGMCVGSERDPRGSAECFKDVEDGCVAWDGKILRVNVSDSESGKSGSPLLILALAVLAALLAAPVWAEENVFKNGAEGP